MRKLVESDGEDDHNEECHDCPYHILKCTRHAVVSVALAPERNHREHLQQGACGADDGHGIDAEDFRGEPVHRNGDKEDSCVEESRSPHPFRGIEGADENGLEAKPEACGQIPAEKPGDEFCRFAGECAAFKENAGRREGERPHGDDRRDEHCEHPRKSAPYSLIQFGDAPFLDKARHIRVACDSDGKSEDGDERVHDAVSVIEAGNS